MTRAARIAWVSIALGCAACTGITFHVEFHGEPVPMALRQRVTEAFSHAEVENYSTGEVFAFYPNGSPIEDVSVRDFQGPKDLVGHNMHMRIVYYDANGRALCAGETDGIITDGVTIPITFYPDGPH